MGQKKKLRKIVSAVKDILGDDSNVRKLKKADAITSFLEEMSQKRVQLADELISAGLTDERKSVITRHIETLDKQSRKLGKILAELDES